MVRRSDREEVVQVALRLPRDMKKQLVDAAWTNRRSVNAEIICLLERGLLPAAAEDQRGAAA